MSIVALSKSATAMGGIDILVNNAGIGSTGDVSVGDDEEWHRVLDINVVGTGRVSAAALLTYANQERRHCKCGVRS